MVQSVVSIHFFGDTGKFSIKIQLFYDDMGVTNPLRSHGYECVAGRIQPLANLKDIRPSYISTQRYDLLHRTLEGCLMVSEIR